jgi:predicted metal-dependent enzyme (double-stranded beta helix superfamily)
MTTLNETGSGVAQPLISINDTREFDRLATLSPTLALRQALPLVRNLAREYAGSPARNRPALPAPDQDGPQIVQRGEGRSGLWWLGFFLWVPGVSTPIHDHTSWGIYCCAGGTLLEERYRRLDDGVQPNRAHLRPHWQRRWGEGDCSELLPYAGGIHRVSNPGVRPAWSVHLYGPRLGPFDGRDYDPTRDYVCDRSEF